MTGDAGVRANIKISQIVHAGAYARGICPVATGVAAQPGAGGTVTVFTRNAFVGTRGGREPGLRNRLERGMTNRATCARLRLTNSNRFGNSGGTRIEQNSVGVG